MNIALPPELEQLVNRLVEQGAYFTQDEVIRDALLLLQEKEEQRQRKFAALKAEIQVGLDQLDRGEWVDGEEVFAELQAKSERLRKSNGE